MAKTSKAAQARVKAAKATIRKLTSMGVKINPAVASDFTNDAMMPKKVGFRGTAAAAGRVAKRKK